jgi:RHS repeat-associated protein
MNQDVDQSSNPAVLYDFLAREYGIQGRWPSPDPAGLLAVDASNPQSWNRYAYVLNNPLAMTDPTGMDGAVYACGDLVSCIIEAIFSAIFDIFQFLFSPPPPPQAAPAPPGGYGGGIDPYGTWDEKLPKGVQVFPSRFPGHGASHGIGSNIIPCLDTPSPLCAKAPEIGWEVLVALGTAAAALAAVKAPFQVSANQRENATAAAAAREIGRRCGRILSKDEKQRLHRMISGQGLGFHEIVEIGVGEFCPGK